MKWAKDKDRFGRENGDWIAQGEKGHFLLWKDGAIWRGLYMHEIGRVERFRFYARTLKEAKAICQENYYWEA